jgi:hypothetical protein
VLASAIVRQGVKAVTGRAFEITQARYGIEHLKQSEGPILDIRRQFAAALAVPDAFSFLIGEAAYHRNILSEVVLLPKRKIVP